MGFFRRGDTEYFAAIGFILIFLLLTFDRDMSVIYLLILLVDQWLSSNDKNISFKYSQKESYTKSIITAVIGTAAFLAFSTIVLSFFPSTQAVAKSQFQSIFNLLATATPILKESKILTLVGWGILIPIIETNFFFGSLLEGFPEILGEKGGFQNVARTITNPNISFIKKITDPMVLFIIFLIAAAFTLFHLSAKGVESIPLLITFVFAIISCLMVIKDRERRGAIYMHIIVNSLTVLTTFGLI